MAIVTRMLFWRQNGVPHFCKWHIVLIMKQSKAYFLTQYNSIFAHNVSEWLLDQWLNISKAVWTWYIKQLGKLSSIEHWGQTDRVTALPRPYALDTGLYLRSWLSITGKLWTWSPAHKLKLKGHSVQKIEWKQTDKRTDRPIVFPFRLTRSVTRSSTIAEGPRDALC